MLQTKTMPEILHLVCRQIFLFTKAQNDNEFTKFFVLQLAVYHNLAQSCTAMRSMCKETATLWQLLQPIQTYVQCVAAVAEQAKHTALLAKSKDLFDKVRYPHENGYIYQYAPRARCQVENIVDYKLDSDSDSDSDYWSSFEENNGPGDYDVYPVTRDHDPLRKGWGIATDSKYSQRVYMGEMVFSACLKDVNHAIEACGHGVFQYAELGSRKVYPHMHKGKFVNGLCNGWGLCMHTSRKWDRVEYAQWHDSKIQGFHLNIYRHKKHGIPEDHTTIQFVDTYLNKLVYWHVYLTNTKINDHTEYSHW